MTARPLAIAHLGTMDDGGGAARVATGLMRGSATRGHRVWHFVGRKRGDDPAVIPLADDDRPAFRFSGYAAAQRALRAVAARHPDRGFGLISRTLRLATHPRAAVDHWRGIEDFEFPGSERFLDALPAPPDIVHGHNLHGGFFDLRALAPISRRVTTVLTMHDMWLLTGHCAHALRCRRWETGCGSCPDLHLDPKVRRDATDRNWLRKRAVFANSRLHIATPSEWLRDQVTRSMLAPFTPDVRVIPNGVDPAIFSPGCQAAARLRLGLPREGAIVLLTAGSRGSMWKDDHMLHRVIAGVAEGRLVAPLFVAVGRDSAARVAGGAPTRSEPYVHDPHRMADYFRAADVYLHAARADTFPLAVLESMACGTPVVATALGGIPEQITPATPAMIRAGQVGRATGMLVAPAASSDMRDALEVLLKHETARRALGRNAVAEVAARFTLGRQVDGYLQWYRELIEARG